MSSNADFYKNFLVGTMAACSATCVVSYLFKSLTKSADSTSRHGQSQNLTWLRSWRSNLPSCCCKTSSCWGWSQSILSRTRLSSLKTSCVWYFASRYLFQLLWISQEAKWWRKPFCRSKSVGFTPSGSFGFFLWEPCRFMPCSHAGR